MSRIYKLISYLYTLYIHSNKIIIPAIVWICFLYFAHTILPINIVSSTALSGIVLFLTMVFVGFTYYDMDSPVGEQLLVLRVKNESTYNLSKVFFLFLIGIAFSLIGVLVPQLLNIVSQFNAFVRKIHIYDVIVSLLLHILPACVGVVTSGLFQARIIRDRKVASLLILLVSVLAITKGAVINQFPFIKYVFWMLPPIDNTAEILANKMYFEGLDVLMICSYYILFCIVGLTVQIRILSRRKF